MTRYLIPVILFLSAWGCGPADVGGHAQLSLSLAVFESNHVLTVYALAPELKDGSALSCSAVETQQVAVDSDADVLAKDAVSGADVTGQASVELTLDEIAVGDNRFFVATLLDNNTAQLAGIGCTGGVVIEAGQEASVNIQVNQL